jgi:hypothetical protein
VKSSYRNPASKRKDSNRATSSCHLSAVRFDRAVTSAVESFSSVNLGEKHCIRISVTFRLYLVKIIQILTN